MTRPDAGSGVTRPDADPPARTVRRRWLTALAMVGLLVLAVVLGGPPGSDLPLDPDSTSPDGLRGVRDLLEEVGVQSEVSLDPPVDKETKVFVPLDLLGGERRQRLESWVRAGGTLVVADAASPLHGLPAGGSGIVGALGATPREPGCDLPALASVGEVVQAGWRGLEVPADGTGCFPLGDTDAWMVVREVGEGTVVALGSAEPFTNAQLDRGDNAVLAAALLGPGAGDRVSVVPRPPVGEGDAALLDLVPHRIWRGLGVVLVGVVLGLVWRGRRLGAPVAERLPPVVPSAELARSVADLLQRARSHDGAAAMLRRTARRELADRLGTTGAAAASSSIDLAIGRLGIPPAIAEAALGDGPVTDDRELLAVARAVSEVRRALDAGDVGAPSHEEL